MQTLLFLTLFSVAVVAHDKMIYPIARNAGVATTMNANGCDSDTASPVIGLQSGGVLNVTWGHDHKGAGSGNIIIAMSTYPQNTTSFTMGPQTLSYNNSTVLYNVPQLTMTKRYVLRWYWEFNGNTYVSCTDAVAQSGSDGEMVKPVALIVMMLASIALFL
ncbi:hypothetical protein PROFUN_06114 [Planoprotostelium fungivorum]|uniref:Uncharacterized protein n=1 Tax=Planoprotostelium fungivorum TaxID=1890364 RepID=A0A2P6NPF2_9EUKA|nr:hypothetical protein PROFUN_06114 [Planoprotostelium fungivorum]